MHSWSWLSLALLATRMPVATAFTATSTFAPAATNLFRRNDICPANTFPCSQELGEQFKDICCLNGQTCARDGDDKPACCPSGAVCTGTAPTTAATGIPTAAISYVPNSYFSFPYAPTSYENEDTCKSAVSACSANHDACLDSLGSGGSYGVTIAVPGGGGVTAAGNGASLGASATSVCSSLSSQACSGLDNTDCGRFGSDAATIYGGLYTRKLLIGTGLLSTLLVAFA